MRFGRWLWVWLALAIPASAPAGALPVAVRTFQLANGLTVLMAPDSQATTVDVAVWYPAGTRYERAGRTGLTHLFDGLMFGGSRRYPAGDHRRLLMAEGATLNTFTTPDYSCFYENMAPPTLDLALRLEADRMGYLTITQRTLDAARLGLRQQRSGGAENSPLGRGLQALFSSGFAGHPYHWPVSGIEADLDHITLQDCLAYYRDRYAPNGALLTLVGRFEPNATEAEVRRLFGALPRRGTKAPPAPLLPQTAAHRGSGGVEVQVPIVLAGWRTPPDADPDVPALDLVGRILARSSTSRLSKNLTGENGVALIARDDYDRRTAGGLLYALIVARPDADSAEVEDQLVTEVEKLGTEPVTTAELDAARRQAEAEVYNAWQTTHGLAQALGNAQMLDGDWGAAERRLARLRELTPSDLQQAAARSLVATRRTLVRMRPMDATSAPDASPPTRPGTPFKRGMVVGKGAR